MEGWELEAREDIRDLVARYNVNGDAGRIDALMTLFAEDAVMEVVGQRVYRGSTEIRALFTGATGDGDAGDTVQLLRHHVSTHLIDLEGHERASGRSYFVVYTRDGVDHWGRYLDTYRKVSQRWRFTSRRVEVEGQIAGGWAERTIRRLAGKAD